MRSWFAARGFISHFSTRIAPVIEVGGSTAAGKLFAVGNCRQAGGSCGNALWLTRLPLPYPPGPHPTPSALSQDGEGYGMQVGKGIRITMGGRYSTVKQYDSRIHLIMLVMVSFMVATNLSSSQSQR